MSRPRRISTPEDIQSITVPLYPEQNEKIADLELTPMEDIPSRAFTTPRTERLNWDVIAVLAFDAAIWIGFVALIGWTFSDIEEFARGFFA